MPRLHLDALFYCIAWSLLAVAGWWLAGWHAGLILSVGLFPIIFLASALMLSKTRSFAAEQAVRWGILATAAIGLFSYLNISGQLPL